MGRHSTSLPKEFHRGPFLAGDAVQAGVGRGRLRGSDLIRPVRGVRARADADLVERCRALLLHRPAGMWFSHTTAARLYRIPLPPMEYGELHVSVKAPARAPQIAGVVGHVAAQRIVSIHRGLPLSRPEVTWLDLATLLRRPALVAAGDFLLAEGLATIESLAGAIESAGRRRGVAAARAAIGLVREGSESPAESTLRVILQDACLTPPHLNYRIHDRTGGFVARVDMAYPEHRVVLEYEGDYHRVDRRQWHKDIRRQGAIEDLGWRVIRVTAADLASPADLIAQVRRALRLDW